MQESLHLDFDRVTFNKYKSSMQRPRRNYYQLSLKYMKNCHHRCCHLTNTFWQKNTGPSLNGTTVREIINISQSGVSQNIAKSNGRDKIAVGHPPRRYGLRTNLLSTFPKKLLTSSPMPTPRYLVQRFEIPHRYFTGKIKSPDLRFVYVEAKTRTMLGWVQ